ncbi:MAG: rhodanese-like domain-containing protein [Thermoanaerobaculia bacterium]
MRRKGRFLTEVAVLIALAILCAGISNLAASPERRLAWIGDYPNALVVPARPAAESPASAVPTTSSSAAPGAAAATYPPHPDRPWVHITGQEAVALYERHIPFLDARRTAVYAEGHVAGARSFPVWETRVQEEIKKLVDEGYDQNAPLVIYCSGGDCEDSHMLAEKLHMFGFNNALVYSDGFPDWEKRGEPVEKGLPR